MSAPLPGMMNIPALANDLRAAADMLDRIASVFAPPPAAAARPAPVLLAAPGRATPSGKARKPAGRKPAKRAAPSAASRGPGKGGGILTDARKEILHRDWPAGVETGRILAALNKLPGRKFRNNQHVASLAARLKLHRPAGGRQPRTPPEDALPAPAPVREPPPAPAPVAATPVPRPAPPALPRRSPPGLASRNDVPSVARRQLAEEAAANRVAPVPWADAMTWAHRNKVPLGGTEEQDLAATNAARLDAQLPPFIIVQGRGLPEALPDPRVGGDQTRDYRRPRPESAAA